MSAEPALSHPNLPPHELAAWEELAHKSNQWPADHEGLTALKDNHVDRVLREKGLGHLVTTHMPAKNGSAASNGNLHVVTEELAPHSQESLKQRREIQGTMEKAEDTLIKIIDGPDFAEYLLQFGANKGTEVPDDTTNPVYWSAAEQYVESRRTRLEATGKVSEQFLDSLTLLASTPSAIFAQKQLDQMRAGEKEFRFRDLSRPDQERYVAYNTTMSTYNTLIRKFAEKNTAVHVEDLVSATETMMDLSFPISEHKAIGDRIAGIIRGAQHEVAFGQVLQELKDKYGFDFEPSTVEEDNGRGEGYRYRKFFDYAVFTPKGDEILVDVKASLIEIKNLGLRGIIGLKEDGTYAVYSCIPEKALNGRFYVEQSEAENVATSIMLKALGNPAAAVAANN